MAADDLRVWWWNEDGETIVGFGHHAPLRFARAAAVYGEVTEDDVSVTELAAGVLHAWVVRDPWCAMWHGRWEESEFFSQRLPWHPLTADVRPITVLDLEPPTIIPVLARLPYPPCWVCGHRLYPDYDADVAHEPWCPQCVHVWRPWTAPPGPNYRGVPAGREMRTCERCEAFESQDRWSVRLRDRLIREVRRG